MYQLRVVLIVATLLSGCESLQRERFLEASNELWGRAGAAFNGTGQPTPAPQNDHSSELDLLFEQPYIDPLTRYLIRYEGDKSRSDVLATVRQERDRRCSVIANQYASKPISQEASDLYRVGYLFSCPQEVNAYAQRLDQLPAQASATDSATSTSGGAAAGEVSELPPSQQLSDCYLLTTIRNFSGASKACRQPAEAGDVQAQTNMALMAYSLRDYATAHHWALRAAPKSGVASYLLGQMYKAGSGVEQDRKQAHYWYAISAEQGHAEAKAALEDPDGLSDGKAVH
ncbi:tetratricopeptide repeat protein [Marinobacter changyiensis]|uniref:tetratricopeptide repeat protein n=1 Tax=Marinobacter changyiensis TaxID=2604091 RepID=UPI0012655458|nr:tetratricopeptide repeat protein [Marinobacter changyiensis]